MQYSNALLALLTTGSLVAAAPGFSKRQTSCSSTYGCPFEITVAGCSATQITDGQVRVANSSISEIADGQVRCDLNGTTPTDFTLANGTVTDASGRVCEISNQDQFQCSAVPDTGATTTGFSVCNGLLAFNGNSSFVACLATGDIPGYNIYTASVDRSTVTDCMAIELDVPACAVTSSSCVASTATVVSTVTPAAVTVSTTATVVSTVTPAPVTATVTATVTNTDDITATVTDKVTATVTATDDITATVTDKVTATVTAVATAYDTVSVTATATLPAVTTTVTAPAVTSTVTDTVTQSAQTVTVTSVKTVAPVATTVQTTTASKTSSTAAAATCTNIDRYLGSSNFPNTIEVVNENSDVSGSSYFGYIGNGNSTIFTFNSVGSSGECSIGFYFPTEAEIQAAGGTTSYDISSSSIAVTLYELDSVAAVTDTYATKPARGASYSATLTPGTNTTFSTFTCSSTQTSYELTATDSNTLSFFEDYNLPILGLVISSC